MQNITDYEIVSDFSPPQLEEKVKAKLDQGWTPQGGICVVHGTPQQRADGTVTIPMFSYQAMIKMGLV